MSPTIPLLWTNDDNTMKIDGGLPVKGGRMHDSHDRHTSFTPGYTTHNRQSHAYILNIHDSLKP
jgi:hypothetical protein